MAGRLLNYVAGWALFAVALVSVALAMQVLCDLLDVKLLSMFS